MKMEIDSKPEALDKLDRRLIQLKIEREAMKKETDDASKKRLAAIEAEIEKLSREYADLEEVWKKEIILVTKTDPNLMGGLKVEIEGRQLDGSVRGRLERLHKLIEQ